MLAERKAKRRIAADPRNTNWTNDDNKFGQKLLQKMGWQKGEGLGKASQGIAQPIQVFAKSDLRGLGSTSHDDGWRVQQVVFEDILAGLSAEFPSSRPSEEPSLSAPSSLTERLKTSKTRLFYKRFAQSKDLSSLKGSDWKCVIGGVTATEQQSGKQSSSALPSSQEDQAQEQNESSKTFASSENLHEYFSRRMNELQMSGARSDPSSSSTNHVRDLEQTSNNYADASAQLCNGCDLIPTRSRSSKRKHDIRSSPSQHATDAVILQSSPAVVTEHQNAVDLALSVGLTRNHDLLPPKQAAVVDQDATKNAPLNIDSLCSQVSRSKKRQKKTITDAMQHENEICSMPVATESVHVKKKEKKAKKKARITAEMCSLVGGEKKPVIEDEGRLVEQTQCIEATQCVDTERNNDSGISCGTEACSRSGRKRKRKSAVDSSAAEAAVPVDGPFDKPLSSPARADTQLSTSACAVAATASLQPPSPMRDERSSDSDVEVPSVLIPIHTVRVLDNDGNEKRPSRSARRKQKNKVKRKVRAAGADSSSECDPDSTCRPADTLGFYSPMPQGSSDKRPKGHLSIGHFLDFLRSSQSSESDTAATLRTNATSSSEVVVTPLAASSDVAAPAASPPSDDSNGHLLPFEHEKDLVLRAIKIKNHLHLSCNLFKGANLHNLPGYAGMPVQITSIKRLFVKNFDQTAFKVNIH